MNAKNQNRSQTTKIVSIGLIFVIFYVAVFFRAYQLQIFGDSKLNHLVESQYTEKLVTEPKRGTIYDRNGEVLAMDVMVASVAVHPMRIKDKAAAIAVLSKYTSLPPAELSEKIKSDKKFVWLERRIPLENGNSIAAAKIPGVLVTHEYRRYYPNKNLAGQVLGAVGYDAKALGGVELALDRYLKSESQLTQAERDARGRLFTLKNDQSESDDVHLTIDKNIQYFAEEALKESAIEHDVKNGFAIVLNVKTGEVLAMANYPEFNPNSYADYHQEVWKNRAVIDTYEPGSTFKTVLLGAALNSGKVTPTDRFHCENGTYRIGDRTIKDDEKNGMLNVQQILQVSSNIGVTKIAFKIGKDTFYQFISSLGFGKKTDMGLLGEASGYLKSAKGWRDIEFSNIAFGQGLSVTGIQMASAYATFANQGERMMPYLVQKIVSATGDVVMSQTPRSQGIVMSKRAAQDLQEILHTVTQTGGTGVAANVAGYLSGGKTGTAQKVDPSTKTYGKGQYVSSFIGFSPLKNPEIVAYIVYDTPRKKSYYGAAVAAPVFKKIAQNTLTYLGVVPTEKTAPSELVLAKKSSHRLPSPEGPSSSDGTLPLGTTGGGTKAKQDYQAIANAIAEKRMPDLTGQSVRSLMKIKQNLNVKIDVNGSGFVVSQTPKPNEDLADVWKLTFSGSS